MKAGIVSITDYIVDPSIERDILGCCLSPKPGPETEVLLVWHQEIDSIYLNQFPNLKAVIRYGVGYDNLDLVELTKRGIIACNTPDYGVDEVADTTIALMLNITRGISRYDVQCRNVDSSGWQQNTISELRRSTKLTLGIIGAGRIGGSVLLKAFSLGFNTLMYDPYQPRGIEKTLRAKRTDNLEEFLTQADIVSLHLTLNKETVGMVNEEFLSWMKHGSSFINTARGKLVSDIDIFYEPMKTGAINSVALDVLPEEPPRPNSLLLNAWRDRENWIDGRLLINPHTAYYSKEAFIEMRQTAAQNALRILNGETPIHQLNLPSKVSPQKS